MKKYLLFSALLYSLSISAIAQTGEEKKVAEAVETLKKAMIDADRTQLEAITANELSYGHSSGKIEDKAAFVEALASGRSDFITMDLSDQIVKVAGKTALVRHILAGEINDNGKAGKVKLGILLVWQKQRGKWKLLARHACKL